MEFLLSKRNQETARQFIWKIKYVEKLANYDRQDRRTQRTRSVRNDQSVFATKKKGRKNGALPNNADPSNNPQKWLGKIYGSKKKKKITSFHTYSDLKYKDHGTILTSNSPHLSSAQDVVLNQRCNRSQISHIVGFD